MSKDKHQAFGVKYIRGNKESRSEGPETESNVESKRVTPNKLVENKPQMIQAWELRAITTSGKYEFSEIDTSESYSGLRIRE